MNDIINQLTNNFDFSCIVSINILTYTIIKIIDDCNGKAKVPKYIKIICLLISIIGVISTYIYCGYENKIILINSAIAAPVAWSWLIKPLFKKFNIDYKNK